MIKNLTFSKITDPKYAKRLAIIESRAFGDGEVYRTQEYKEFLLSYKQNGSLIYGVQNGRSMIGFAHFVLGKDFAELGSIAILPEVQGQKIGTKLLNYCFHDLSAIRQSITLAPMHTEQAFGFYKSLGFTYVDGREIVTDQFDGGKFKKILI